ncbi:Alpha/Beta hydrolase protein [Phycomyces nitens]|nr:Alpha/Beta hydrolase protein [Phycomyces nitens]
MSFTHACCTIPPVKSDYQPTGVTETIGDLTVYRAGPKDAKKAILVIYDIFGFYPNTKQFCDILANHCGYKVIMPDFFYGKPYKPEDMGDIPKLLSWIAKNGSFEVIYPLVQRAKAKLQEEGIVAAGIVGFCWGAKIAVQVTAVDPFFAAASLIHPSFIDVKDAEKANAPILAIPSKNEADMTEYMAVLAKKPFGPLCEHYRFDDVHHGFAASRADWSNEVVRKRATQAIQLTANFFNKIIKV